MAVDSIGSGAPPPHPNDDRGPVRRPAHAQLLEEPTAEDNLDTVPNYTPVFDEPPAGAAILDELAGEPTERVIDTAGLAE